MNNAKNMIGIALSEAWVEEVRVPNVELTGNQQQAKRLANQHQHREDRHHPFLELPPGIARRVGILRRTGKERLVAPGTIQLLHFERLNPLSVNQM